MTEVLGEGHPHTLFARASYANVPAERGLVEEA